MAAIDRVRGGPRFLYAHLCYLVLRKAIGLEISQAPPRIAETRPLAPRPLIGLGRLLLLSGSLKGVAERHMQIGGCRRCGQQLAIQRNRRLVFSEAKARGCVE